MPAASIFSEIGVTSPIKLPKPVGCEKCNNTGFRGRTAIYEVVPVDDKLRQLIHSQVAEFELESYARTKTPSIRADGLKKVLAGKTTLEEVLRVTKETDS
jgi:general secretion pathway protein E